MMLVLLSANLNSIFVTPLLSVQENSDDMIAMVIESCSILRFTNTHTHTQTEYGEVNMT